MAFTTDKSRIADLLKQHGDLLERFSEPHRPTIQSIIREIEEDGVDLIDGFQEALEKGQTPRAAMWLHIMSKARKKAAAA